MAAEKPGKTSWRPSDVAKATAAAAKAPGDPNSARPGRPDPIEVGARAIYEFRSHPRRTPWNRLSDKEQAIYLERMRLLVAALALKRYVIK